MILVETGTPNNQPISGVIYYNEVKLETKPTNKNQQLKHKWKKLKMNPKHKITTINEPVTVTIYEEPP